MRRSNASERARIPSASGWVEPPLIREMRNSLPASCSLNALRATAAGTTFTAPAAVSPLTPTHSPFRMSAAASSAVIFLKPILFPHFERSGILPHNSTYVQHDNEIMADKGSKSEKHGYFLSGKKKLSSTISRESGGGVFFSGARHRKSSSCIKSAFFPVMTRRETLSAS